MNAKIIGFLLGAMSLAGCTSQEVTRSPEVSGEVLFKAKQCYTCHTIGRGNLAGPDLKGLFSRRTEDWVRQYISDPVTMVQTDPIARTLKQRYKIQMPKLNLSIQEIEQLVTYLKKATP